MNTELGAIILLLIVGILVNVYTLWWAIQREHKHTKWGKYIVAKERVLLLNADITPAELTKLGAMLHAVNYD